MKYLSIQTFLSLLFMEESARPAIQRAAKQQGPQSKIATLNVLHSFQDRL